MIINKNQRYKPEIIRGIFRLESRRGAQIKDSNDSLFIQLFEGLEREGTVRYLHVLAADQGFEPQLLHPECSVLPLHQSAMCFVCFLARSTNRLYLLNIFFFINLLPAADLKYFSLLIASILSFNFSEYIISQGIYLLENIPFPVLCSFNRLNKLLVIPT